MQRFHRKWFWSMNLTQEQSSLFYLFISGCVTRSPLPCPEHKGAADAGGEAEGGRQGRRHQGECARGLAEVQPQVLTVQQVTAAPAKSKWGFQKPLFCVYLAQ